MEHWAKLFSEKVTPKHVQNTFGHFWERFWAFLKIFENFLTSKFSKTRPSMEHWANKTFRKKLPRNMFKTRLDTFGNDFERFWNIENFLIFLKVFEDSTLHGTLGKIFFEKNTPKHVQNTFGHFWERF